MPTNCKPEKHNNKNNPNATHRTAVAFFCCRQRFVNKKQNNVGLHFAAICTKLTFFVGKFLGNLGVCIDNFSFLVVNYMLSKI